MAFALGERHLGRTWPNPSVGTVVVAHDAEPRIIAQGITGEECRGDQDAVGEVVQAIPHQDHPAGLASLVGIMTVFMSVAIALVVVGVAQDRHLLQQEKSEQAGKQRREQGMRIGIRLESFR